MAERFNLHLERDEISSGITHARCLFRAVSVRFASRNYRRILLLRLATLPLPPLPSTPARLLGRVFRHVVAVCSTIITAI